MKIPVKVASPEFFAADQVNDIKPANKPQQAKAPVWKGKPQFGGGKRQDDRTFNPRRHHRSFASSR